MITLCALLLNFGGAVLVYLASHHQRLRPESLPWPARAAGWLAVMLATVCWWRTEGMGAGIAISLTCVMLSWVALPYVSWWRMTPAEASKP